MARYLLLLDSYGLVFVGRPLWREDGSVFCICCWPLLTQSFSGPSPLGLATIFYCLIFETSIFVASYKSIPIAVFSFILSARTTYREHSPSIVAWSRPHRKHLSRVRLRVHWSVTSIGRGAEEVKNTTSSIVACWTVFTELLPGNSLIKSVTISYILVPWGTWSIEYPKLHLKDQPS
jgi:hypothetical protein